MTNYDGYEWYPAALTEPKPCSVCRMNENELHPFTKQPVSISLYVRGDLWHGTQLFYLVLCDECRLLSFEKSTVQGVLI